MKNVITIIVIAIAVLFSTSAVAQEKHFSRQGGDYWTPPPNPNVGFTSEVSAPDICEQVNRCNRGYTICQVAMDECASLKTRVEAVEKDLVELKKCVTCAKPVKRPKVKKLAEDAAKLPPEIQAPFNERVLVVLGKDYYSKADVDVLIVNLRDLLEARVTDLERRVGDLEKRADANDRDHNKIDAEQGMQNRRLDNHRDALNDHEARITALEEKGTFETIFDLQFGTSFIRTPKFYSIGQGVGMAICATPNLRFELMGYVGSDIEGTPGLKFTSFGTLSVVYSIQFAQANLDLGLNALVASQNPQVGNKPRISYAVYGGGAVIRVSGPATWAARPYLALNVDLVGYSDWNLTPGERQIVFDEGAEVGLGLGLFLF